MSMETDVAKQKSIVLHDVDVERARMLRDGIKMARCWMTGFAAGRAQPGVLDVGIPGQEELRQLQIILAEAITKTS